MASLDDGLLLAAGFTDCGRLPTFAHYSPGVDVETFGLQNCEAIMTNAGTSAGETVTVDDRWGST
ncbi:hypothetical protein [Bythopirellula goksoeyrii]|uniref:hypothetical protein n=1 Tax=Bythopirellula goksoeyrii TaxID=1400387 RepID=UPI00143CF9C3|nr:hypothetical protein [Bythopirellula goksoeyrii]